MLNSEIFLSSKGEIFQDRYCLLFFFPVSKVNRKANPLNYRFGFINTTNKGETCGVRGKRVRPSALGHHIHGAPDLLVPFQYEKRVPGLKKGRLQES